ncbi:MAG: alkaline phosphatase D family protein [Candidatus Methylomirabilis sp.]
MILLRWSMVVLAAALFLYAWTPQARQGSEANREIRITHGIASGDVTSRSAVIWARASDRADMHVDYDISPGFPNPRSKGTSAASEATDYTASVKLERLKPATRYYYRAWFSRQEKDGRSNVSQRLVGTFRTAPAASARRPVRFVFGGDLGGQRYCRRVDQGYAIFSTMKSLAPDFFVANGDMIYADGDCPAIGPDGWQNIPGDFPSVADPLVSWTDPVGVRDVYLEHWRYNRADPHFQSFLQGTSMYAQWDDHEVINDFGGSWSYLNARKIARSGYPNLVRAGRDAVFSYSPIDRNPDEPTRIYRSFNWGKFLDLFILDARSYRSRNDLPDTPENRKTMLGRSQLEWLKQGLLNSKATWKVISSDVPLSIPTGGNDGASGRDGWANGTTPDFSSQTGFERELLELVKFLDDKDIFNVVVITTDVHFAATIRYEVDAKGDGDTLLFHELVTGPLNARRGVPPSRLDPTLNPVLLYSEGGIFNFGYVRIYEGSDGKVHLVADVRGEDGQPRPGSLLNLVSQEPRR